MEIVDCVIVGAGVVGLAVAGALARAGREVLILEADNAIGTGTSSRNSEVVHAGIYYRNGSLMAATCVEGRNALYAYCAERGIPHRRCGKLIVATDGDEAAALQAIGASARRNGVEDLQFLSAAETLAIEPELRAEAALLSPSSGIIDSHAYMLSLQADAEAAGVFFCFHSPVVGGEAVSGGIKISVGGSAPVELIARTVVNCAGLAATWLARHMTGVRKGSVPRTYFAKGNYMVLVGRCPFKRLVYPVPVPGGLGIHLTLDLGGQARFGPDVQWVDEIDYRVDESRVGVFEAAIRRYWPGFPDGSLSPGYAGIRPKLGPEGAPAQDFMIQKEDEHAIPGLINLFGIESPGLTASLSLARLVARAAGHRGSLHAT